MAGAMSGADGSGAGGSGTATGVDPFGTPSPGPGEAAGQEAETASVVQQPSESVPAGTEPGRSPGPLAGDSGDAGVAEASPEPAGDDAATPAVDQEPLLAVTADFLKGTLSFLDVRKLKPGATRSDVVVDTVDLSGYAPAPLALNVTPDGQTVVVSVSAGFLGAFIDVPPGSGMLVFVDVATREVTGTLDVGDSPMGIVFSADSRWAYVGLYGEGYLAVVDMEDRTYTPVRTGANYNEELAIDDSGDVGILTFGPTGNAKTFAVGGTPTALGETRGLSGDAAGVAFFPGTRTAYLMQAPTVLTGYLGGHDLVDVSDPQSPRTSDGVRMTGAPMTYPVTPVHARQSVAFPASVDGTVSIVEMRLQGAEAIEVNRVEAGPAESLAYGITETPDGRVLVAVPGEHYIGVVDLETQESFQVPWEQSESGPTEIKVVP